jgi:hypothetical protein
MTPVRSMFSRFALPLVALAAVGLFAALLPHGALLALMHVAPAGVLSASVFFPWKPAKSADELQTIAFPELASQPEVIPHCFYDTQSLATGAVGPFNFFVNTNNDRTLSNMDSQGQLPDPQYLEVFYVTCDILQPPVANAADGGAVVNAAWANIANILTTNRATFEVTLASKSMGIEPLTFAHSSGGLTGGGYGYGTAAAGQSSAYGNAGIPGTGGFPYNGSLVIPPKNAFKLTVAVAGALTLVGGPINVRMGLVGNWYRRVN